MMMRRFLSCLSVGSLMLIGGCSQFGAGSSSTAATPDEGAETPAVSQGVKTAARVVVGQVVGTPARVAMAAERVVEVAADKVDGSSQNTSSTSAE